MIKRLVNCPVCPVRDGPESGLKPVLVSGQTRLHPFDRYAVLSMYWLNWAKLETLKTGRGAFPCKTHCNFFFYHAEATLFLGAVYLFVKHNSNTNHAHNDFSTAKSRVNCSADTAISRDL